MLHLVPNVAYIRSAAPIFKILEQIFGTEYMCHILQCACGSDESYEES